MRGTKTEIRRGVWRLRVVVGYDPATGNPQERSRRVYGTKKVADDALAGYVTEMRTGTTITSTDSLNALLDRWLEHIEGNLSPTTIRGYREKLNRVRRDLGAIKLSDLTAQKLDRAYAEKWHLVDRPATDRATPPTHSNPPVRAPSPEVVLGLIEVAKRRELPVLAAAIFVAAATGLRRGEMRGLRWSGVDFDARTLTVARAVKHNDGPGWSVGDTKTHEVRRIAIDPATVDVLTEHRARKGAAAGAGLGRRRVRLCLLIIPTFGSTGQALHRRWLKLDVGEGAVSMTIVAPEAPGGPTSSR